MTNSILAYVTPILLETLLVLFVLGVFIDFTVTVVRYIMHSNVERRRLRLEVGKLTDEFQRIRKHKGAKGCHFTDESG